MGRGIIDEYRLEIFHSESKILYLKKISLLADGKPTDQPQKRRMKNISMIVNPIPRIARRFAFTLCLIFGDLPAKAESLETGEAAVVNPSKTPALPEPIQAGFLLPSGWE